MEIISYSLGQLQANCYFLTRENNCLIIDPADEAGFILEELQRRDLNLVGMLATHGHFDHIMAAGEIQLSFNVPLYIFDKDRFLVDRLIETAEYFLGYKPAIIKPKKIRYINENSLKIENFQLKIIATPGHTPGSCCFHFRNEKIVFTGDTLFKDGVGRTDLSYSSAKDLHQSLTKIFKLPKAIIVYPGHGEASTIGEEASLYRF